MAVGPEGRLLLDRAQKFPDHDAALSAMLDWLRHSDLELGIEAVGHWVVHGWPDYATTPVVSDARLAAVRRLVPFDSEHLLQAFPAIDATARAMRREGTFPPAGPE
jgi:acetate kinase